MTGSLQIKRGVWHVVISYKDETGKHKTKWISTKLPERGNKKSAKEILDRELSNFEKSLQESNQKLERRKKPKEVDRTKITMPFHDYCDEYVESIKGKVSLVVYKGYKRYINKIREFFGKDNLRLIDITDEEINAFYAHEKSRGIKNSTLKHYDSVLRPALRRAYKDKLIPDNPYESIDVLKKGKTTMKFFNDEEMRLFLDIIKGHHHELAFKLSAYYGLRRSEVVGIRWNSIDFEHDLLHINHKVLIIDNCFERTDILKTKGSYRTLPLFPAIKEMLLEHKTEIEENKQFYANSYNTEFLEYVLVKEDGKLISPDALTCSFRTVLKKNNLKRIRLHDLRHSCASILLAKGIQMKQIQEWLGHSNFATTADVYSHLDFKSKIQAANAIGYAFGDGEMPTQKSLRDTEQLIEHFTQIALNEGFGTLDEYLDFHAFAKIRAENSPKTRNGLLM